MGKVVLWKIGIGTFWGCFGIIGMSRGRFSQRCPKMGEVVYRFTTLLKT